MKAKLLGFINVHDKGEPPNHWTDHLMQVVAYLGVGALVHAWFLGAEFDMKNLWSWGYLLAWPVPMFGWLLMTVAVIGGWLLVALAVCAASYWTIIWVIDIRHGAKTKALLDEFAKSGGLKTGSPKID